VTAGGDAGAGVSTGQSTARPARLSELRLATWRGVLVRGVRGFKSDNCLDLAAALTYWSLLALFPTLIVVVALVSLVATSEEAVNTLLEIARDLAPATVVDAVEGRIREVVGERTAARVLLSFGVLGSLWTASAYLRSFTRAANAIYGVSEGRKAYRLIPLQLLTMIVGLVLAATILVGLIVSGPVASAVGSAIGVGETVVAVWNAAKWPVLILIAGLLLSLMFWLAPNVRQPRFRWLTVGSAVTLLVWIIVSAGFGFYVANFGAYEVTYGALGAIIVFLVWLFLSNCAVLLGVEINAELQRGRQLQSGWTIDLDGPPLPPRTPAG
jgi:membrane protein